MKERPILFSAPMVRAILEGRKTQTRRVVSDRNSQGNYKASCLQLEDAFTDPGPSPAGNPGPYLKAEVRGSRDITERLYPRFFPGDRLWVRETFNWSSEDALLPGEPHKLCAERAGYRENRVVWAADGNRVHPLFGKPVWRPSIHMPRWASRITLEVTGVRVERLQDISEADCVAEGIRRVEHPNLKGWEFHDEHCLTFADGSNAAAWTSAEYSYRHLWEQINGAGSWDANQWVWVVEFQRVGASNGALHA